MQLQLINNNQPHRPTHLEDGAVALHYRTRPSRSNYKVCDKRNQVCQMKLYRWCRSEFFVTAPAVSELHDFLFEDRDGVSKKIMGETVLQALRFNPRKLKGATKEVEKAFVMYVFTHAEELQYGLEWMICIWLRKFLNDTKAPEEPTVVGPKMMAEFLDHMARCPDKEFQDIYIDPIRAEEWKMKEPDWDDMLRIHGPENPLVIASPKAKERRPPREWRK